MHQYKSQATLFAKNEPQHNPATSCRFISNFEAVNVVQAYIQKHETYVH